MMDYDTLYRAFEAERKLRIATQEALWAAEQERNAARVEAGRAKAWARAWKQAAKKHSIECWRLRGILKGERMRREDIQRALLSLNDNLPPIVGRRSWREPE